MKNEIHHIDEYFSEGLSHIEVEPPADVWKNIEKELNRRRNVRLITIWTSLAAGITLFISLGIYIINNDKQNNQYVNNIGSEQNTQTIKNNTTSKSASIIKQQYSDAQTTDKNIQGKVTKITNTELASVDKSETDVKPELYSQDARNGSSEMAVSTKDETNEGKTTESSFLNESKYIIAETAKPDSGIQVQPQIVSNNTPNININNDIKSSDKNLISAIEVVNPLTEYGNKDVNEKAKTNTWSIEGQVAPQYSYRNISEIKGYEPSKDIYNDSEDGLLAYGGGLKVNYQTGKRLSFQAGVYYSVMGQTMNNVYEIKEPAGMNTYADQQKAYFINNSSFGQIKTQETEMINDQPNNTVFSSTSHYSSVYINSKDPAQGFLKEVSANQSTLLNNAQIIQQLKFIEVPFTARYKLINKKIGCHVIGGLSTNILINSDVWLKQNGSKELIGETSNLQRINYSSLIGLGIDYQWFKNISLSIEPTYKYYLNSISVNENVKVHPYSFGIFTGLIYRF